MIEPLKYLLTPVAYERDDETGRVLREMPGETVTVYSAEQAKEAIEQFEAKLSELVASQNGAGP
jgi:hypothetical protein